MGTEDAEFRPQLDSQLSRNSWGRVSRWTRGRGSQQPGDSPQSAPACARDNSPISSLPSAFCATPKPSNSSSTCCTMSPSPRVREGTEGRAERVGSTSPGFFVRRKREDSSSNGSPSQQRPQGRGVSSWGQFDVSSTPLSFGGGGSGVGGGGAGGKERHRRNCIFKVFVIFRGGWCTGSHTLLKGFAGLNVSIKNAGGKVVAISSQSSEQVARAARDLELPFQAYGDPTNKLVHEMNRRFDMGCTVSNNDMVTDAYPNGMAQPCVLAVFSDDVQDESSVLFKWTRWQTIGSLKHEDAWAEILRALSMKTSSLGRPPSPAPVAPKPSTTLALLRSASQDEPPREARRNSMGPGASGATYTRGAGVGYRRPRLPPNPSTSLPEGEVVVRGMESRLPPRASTSMPEENHRAMRPPPSARRQPSQRGGFGVGGGGFSGTPRGGGAGSGGGGGGSSTAGTPRGAGASGTTPRRGAGTVQRQSSRRLWRFGTNGGGGGMGIESFSDDPPPAAPSPAGAGAGADGWDSDLRITDRLEATAAGSSNGRRGGAGGDSSGRRSYGQEENRSAAASPVAAAEAAGGGVRRVGAGNSVWDKSFDSWLRAKRAGGAGGTWAGGGDGATRPESYGKQSSPAASARRPPPPPPPYLELGTPIDEQSPYADGVGGLRP